MVRNVLLHRSLEFATHHRTQFRLPITRVQGGVGPGSERLHLDGSHAVIGDRRAARSPRCSRLTPSTSESGAGEA